MPGGGSRLHGSRRTDRHLRDRRMQFCAAEVGGDLVQAADDEGQNQEQGAAGYVGNVSQGGEMPEPTVVPTPRAITAPRPGFLPRSLVLDIDNVSPFAFCAAAVHTGTLFVFWGIACRFFCRFPREFGRSLGKCAFFLPASYHNNSCICRRRCYNLDYWPSTITRMFLDAGPSYSQKYTS